MLFFYNKELYMYKLFISKVHSTLFYDLYMETLKLNFLLEVRSVKLFLNQYTRMGIYFSILNELDLQSINISSLFKI